MMDQICEPSNRYLACIGSGKCANQLSYPEELHVCSMELSVLCVYVGGGQQFRLLFLTAEANLAASPWR
jgi:hypothetical protein